MWVNFTHSSIPSLISTSACNATHYGQNCANTCQCVLANTQDCNDTNGVCTCKAGWTGTWCDTDVNECANSSRCPNANETCKNLNGSYECGCADGFQRATPAAQCQACDSTHYGANCSNTCICMTANTQDCNDVNGTCTCISGWTGVKCDQLVQECSNPKLCTGANESCYNLTGSAVCGCVAGFEKITSGGACQACNATHYGQNCANTCQCALANTQDCNDTNGVCTCKAGWTGTWCDTDVNECANSSRCPNANETCKNLNGSYECGCADGFQRATPNAQCQACSPPWYGYNCSFQFSCVTNNIVAYNTVNGNCTCKPGWKGANCELDIDECQTEKYCKVEHQICHNENGSAYCDCDIEYKNVENVCEARFLKFDGEIRLNLTRNDNVFNITTKEFRALRDEVIKELERIAREVQKITSFLKITITHFTPGSVVAHTQLYIDTNSTIASVEAEQFFTTLPNKNITINGTHVAVLDVVYIPPMASTDNNGLIIGLAVGIPLFVILLTVITVCVWLYMKRRSAKHTRTSTPSEDREAPFRSIFATQIATKGSWGTPSLYTPDAYSDAGTSQSSRDGQLIKGNKKRSEFKASAWYDTQAASTSTERPVPQAEGQTSNFSWEYMFTLLEPHKGFEIQRPNYSPSPNPAFVKKAKGDDSKA